MTVTAQATAGAEATLRAFNAVTTVDAFEIARDAPGSIGEALENEPGIANRSFGPGSSRPIIRGFGGDRVHIIEDGIPTGDLSSTSDHHGVNDRPEQRRADRDHTGIGNTALYGSNIVGLINVITPHAAYRNLLTPPESYGDTLLDGTRGRLGTDAGSANRQVGTCANVQHSRGKLLYWGSGTQGLGKTMPAKNIAHQAILAGHSALFTTAADLLLDLNGRRPPAPSNAVSSTTPAPRYSRSTSRLPRLRCTRRRPPLPARQPAATSTAPSSSPPTCPSSAGHRLPQRLLRRRPDRPPDPPRRDPRHRRPELPPPRGRTHPAAAQPQRSGSVQTVSRRQALHARRSEE